MCWYQTEVYWCFGFWLNQVLSITERQITDSPIFSTVTYSADQKQSAQVGQSAWPLKVPRFSEASIPSVGWHLMAIK